MEKSVYLVALIPLLPFLGAFLNGVLLRGRIGKPGVIAIALGSVGLAALLALGIIGSYASHAAQYPYGLDLRAYSWIPAGALHTAVSGIGNLQIEMGFFLDPLACVMLFV